MSHRLLQSLALAGALAACGGAKQSASPGPSTTEAVPAGHYGCRIILNGWAYDFYACDVRREGDALVIEKIEGQMRFKGTLAPDGGGSLVFAGDVWCTWDEGCKGSSTGRLDPMDGGWEGMLAPYATAGGDTMPPMTITLMREAALESAGGARYGGYGEGGWKGGGFTGELGE